MTLPSIFNLWTSCPVKLPPLPPIPESTTLECKLAFATSMQILKDVQQFQTNQDRFGSLMKIDATKMLFNHFFGNLAKQHGFKYDREVLMEYDPSLDGDLVSNDDDALWLNATLTFPNPAHAVVWKLSQQ